MTGPYQREWRRELAEAVQAGLETHHYTEPHFYWHLTRAGCPHAQLDPYTALTLEIDEMAHKRYKYVQMCCAESDPDWDRGYSSVPYAAPKDIFRRPLKRAHFRSENFGSLLVVPWKHQKNRTRCRRRAWFEGIELAYLDPSTYTLRNPELLSSKKNAVAAHSESVGVTKFMDLVDYVIDWLLQLGAYITFLSCEAKY